jgi:hypothetical protein
VLRRGKKAYDLRPDIEGLGLRRGKEAYYSVGLGLRRGT